MLQEQTEVSRRRGRHASHVGSHRLMYYTGHFIRELMSLENIQLIVIMIGEALCVPSEVSPIAFAKQTVCRTLILGALACLWIHAQLRRSIAWLRPHNVAIQQLVKAQLWSGDTGMKSMAINSPCGLVEAAEGVGLDQRPKDKAADNAVLPCSGRRLSPPYEWSTTL
jgi:hypothetical protein